jgi:hypothetical protein
MQLTIKGLHKQTGKWITLAKGEDDFYNFDEVPQDWLVNSGMILGITLGNSAFRFDTSHFMAFRISYKDK